MCVLKQDLSLTELNLLSPKECSEVHVREEKDLISYSITDENHFCHLLELERSNEYCRTSAPKIILAKAGELFYKDGAYTQFLCISFPSMVFSMCIFK